MTRTSVGFATWMRAGGLVLLFALASAMAPASDEQKTQEGTVVTAGGGKLVMVGEGNQEQSYDIGAEVVVTVNGRLGKLEDLQKGMRIRVTADAAGKVVALATVDEAKHLVTSRIMGRPSINGK